jgi:TonB-linked SusC/RagA family outer membrane protein
MRKSAGLLKILFFFIAWGCFISIQAQGKAISGKVVDSDSGDPIIGATVVVKGTTNGTITSTSGTYTLSAASTDVLAISFIGYKTQEIAVGDQSVINITLVPDVLGVDEVVVIGYGQVKKTDATGSVAVIGTKDLNKGAITSPQELIVGKIAGVVVTPGSGAPGSGSTIRIRGGSSLTASNDPLIIIDGVPVDNGSISGMANPMSTINPNDIESFSVLKDASATAIYGSRASNGVIIITTKKGKSGKMRIDYNGTMSVYTVPKLTDVYSADEYRALQAEHNPDQLGLLGDANTDWQKEIYQNALGQDHNVTLSGAIKEQPYRASVGYTNQDGILKTSNLNRTTLSLGFNPTFFDETLKLNINAKGVYNKSRFANESAVGSAVQFDPTQPVKDNGAFQEGYYTWTTTDKDGNVIINDQAPDNPVALLELTNDMADVYRSIGNFQADYQLPFLKELRMNLNLGYDYSHSDGDKYTPANTSFTSEFLGNSETYFQDRQMELLEYYLNYKKDFEFMKSSLDVTGGYSWQHFYYDSGYKRMTADESKINGEVKAAPSEYFLVSFFGRVNYSMLDKYLFTATIREDGSSKFKNNKWGFFPSAAFKWKIKNESFMENASVVSDLNLRLSYGETGQQDVANNYPSIPLYTFSSSDNTAQYQLGNTYYNTVRPEGYDENIKWETTKTYNAGVDFGFMNNRLTGSIDIYQRDTYDMLNTISVPAGSNLRNEITTNIGSMTNKGVELSLTGKIISRKDFYWDLTYNVGYNENELTGLTLLNDPNVFFKTGDAISGAVGNKIKANQIGYPVNSFSVYQQVFGSDNMPVEGLYVDQNSDGKITEAGDLYLYQKASPDYLMGIASRMTYKNWDFSFSGRVSIGNYVYNNVASNYGNYKGLYNSGNNYTGNVLKSVTKTNFENPQYFSDFYVENGSFFRMDNINFGYNFQNPFGNSTRLRVSATVQNAFVVTNYSGLDPEVFNGVDSNVYPRPRTFVVGVELGF